MDSNQTNPNFRVEFDNGKEQDNRFLYDIRQKISEFSGFFVRYFNILEVNLGPTLSPNQVNSNNFFLI